MVTISPKKNTRKPSGSHADPKTQNRAGRPHGITKKGIPMKTAYTLSKTIAALVIAASLGTVLTALWRNGSLAKVLGSTPASGLGSSTEDDSPAL